MSVWFHYLLSQALQPQAHNAHIARDPVSGLLLLYHIHVPNRTCAFPDYNCSVVCQNGSTPHTLHSSLALYSSSSSSSSSSSCSSFSSYSSVSSSLSPTVGPHVGTINWTHNSGALHSSTSFDGPWSGVIGGPFIGCENPSPFFLPNGSVQRVCAGHGYIPFVGSSPSYLGPYTPQNESLNLTCSLGGADYHSEDAVLWQDRRGNFHAFSHSMSVWPDPAAMHFFSSDAVHWHCSDHPAYNGTIAFDDGTTIDVAKRERPKVLLNQDGDLQVLFTAVVPVNEQVDDYAYTLAVPIRQASQSGGMDE